MTYLLKCLECKSRFEVTCALVYKPDTHTKLTMLSESGNLHIKSIEADEAFQHSCSGPLEIDWERMKPQRVNINWERIEDIK